MLEIEQGDQALAGTFALASMIQTDGFGPQIGQRTMPWPTCDRRATCAWTSGFGWLDGALVMTKPKNGGVVHRENKGNPIIERCVRQGESLANARPLFRARDPAENYLHVQLVIQDELARDVWSR